MTVDGGEGPSNALGAGVTETDLVRAIEVSGYPLQLQVGAQLRSLLRSPTSSVPGFAQDEWSFVDGETGAMRTLDLHATLWLADPSIDRDAQPQMQLLVECKRSDYPFVFFPATNLWLPNFPSVVGVPHETLEIRFKELQSIRGAELAISQCLLLNEAPSLVPQAQAITLSTARRDGKALVLTGSTSYNETVLPLVKGFEYLRSISRPRNKYFECIVVVLLCVLEAPMVLARPTHSGTKLEYPSWVRLIRDEPRRESDSGPWRPHAIDYVHASFLEEYVTRHLLPFGELFHDRVLKHWQVLASGAAFADDLSQPRLEATMTPTVRTKPTQFE